MTKASLSKKYRAAMSIDSRSTEQEIRAVFPSLSSLVEFVSEVGKLSYPESYGASPWERAFSIGYIAAGNKVTNPYVLESEDYAIAMRYRSEEMRAA